MAVLAGGCPARVSGTGGSRSRAGRAREDSGTDGEVRLERSLKHLYLKLRKFKDVKKWRFSGKGVTKWIPEA